MEKTKRKNAKKAVSPRSVCKNRSKAAEYVSNLLELNKLQRVLLRHLDREV